MCTSSVMVVGSTGQVGKRVLEYLARTPSINEIVATSRNEEIALRIINNTIMGSNICKIYPKISLSEERSLIAKAKAGAKKSRDELVFRHIGFLIFRIKRRVFSEFLQRFGEDLFGEGILLINAKIEDYNLAYCNKQGYFHPVRFKSYIWKRIDGFIIDYLKKELAFSKRVKQIENNF